MSVSSSPSPCGFSTPNILPHTTYLPQKEAQQALIDANLPFMSPYPVPPPFTLKDFSSNFKPKPPLKPPKLATIQASTFVYSGSIFIEVKFEGARLAGQIEIRNSCDSRIGLIGAFLALSLSPSGQIRLEVPRKATQEQLKQIIKTIHQARYNASTDIVISLLQEIQADKYVAFEIGEGKKSRLNYQYLGVYYDHMKQFVIGQEEYSSELKNDFIQYKFPLLYTVKEIQKMNIGCFKEQNYANYLDNSYQYVSQFTDQLCIKKFIQCWIYEISGMTVLILKNKSYSFCIKNSIKHRRLLICLLIAQHLIKSGETLQIEVESPIIPVILNCYHDYLSDYHYYQDMDILLIIAVNQQQQQKYIEVTELQKQIVDTTLNFQGTFTDYFHNQILNLPEPIYDEETTQTTIIQQEISDYQVIPECKIIKQKSPRLTKEYIRKMIQQYNFDCLQLNKPKIRRQHEFIALTLTKMSITMQAIVNIDGDSIILQYLRGRYPKFSLSVQNSSPLRRIALGIIIVLISSPPDQVVEFLINSTIYASFKIFIQSQKCSDLQYILQSFAFKITPSKLNLLQNAIFLANYQDSE
ncbi:hypothetical protein SS50377_25791 [Spironucleus salmonicida]|uniref:Uncharacterized protein n=1 Tax=Spironucleus salmonicida TaxID=348837 RepID=V6LVH1_9EUKA|nr:hypothetical protein SS50377_25791 [Spironucleus salmonicida]|eukprot:EST48233.1 Hypothetical protein SS50377_11575 [Spironucleus salmonicida]